MLDHVRIAVRDRAASEAFYDAVLSALGVSRSQTAADHAAWRGFRVAAAGDQQPPARGLHVAFAAADREQVDAFWRAGVAAGYRDDGRPGPRPRYRDDYYGGFLLDPDGNSAEAVHHRRVGVPGGVDHLWIRVADVDAAARFYAAIAPRTGYERGPVLGDPRRVLFRAAHSSFSVVEGPPSEHVHLAFAAGGGRVVRDPDGNTVRVEEGLSS